MIENKLRKIFEETIENNKRKYEGSLKHLPCSDLILSSISTKKNYRYETNNLCMLNYKYHGEDSVLMIFAIPIKSSEDSRPYNERVFDVLRDVEEAFITLDYRQLKEFEEDKYMYFICIKVIEEEDDYI